MKRLILTVWMTVTVAVSAQHSDNLSLQARWASGPCRAIFTTADALHMGNGSYLDILDAENYDNRFARYTFPGLIQDIYYQSFKVYVAVQNSGVYVLDRSLITNPTLAGTWASGGDVRRLAYQDGYIYVANGSWGFSVIRTSDFDQVAVLQFTSPVQDVYVSGNTAYLAVDAVGLVSVNITNPAAPVRLDTVKTPDKAFGVSVRGTQAFVADRTHGVLAVNVTNPSNMAIADQWEAGDNALLSDIAVDVGAEKAYVSDEGYGLRVIDLTTMNQATSLNTGGEALAVYLGPDYAYLADGNDGLREIDVAVAPPQENEQIMTGGSAMDLVLTANTTYVAGGQSGVWILDNSQLHDSQVTLRSHWDTENAQGLALAGSVLIIADGPGGLLFYNVSNPLQPAYITHFQTASEFLDVTVAGDYAYAAEGTAGVRKIDVTNPFEPLNQGMLEGVTGIRAVGVEADARSNRLYVSADTNGVKVVNIPTQTIVGSYKSSSHTMAVGLQGEGSERIYLADGPNGLVGLNVSNLENIVPAGQYNTDGYAYDVSFHDNVAVVADGQGTMRLIDTSNEEEFSEVGYYHTAGSSYGIKVMGDTLALADGIGGVYYFSGDFTGQLVIDADSVHFGSVVLGQSRSLWVRVVNAGTASVYVNESTSTSGRFYGANLPRWISPGEDWMEVRFAPSTTGTVRDTLRFYSDATNSPHLLKVIGTGVNTIDVAAYQPDYYTFMLYHMNALEGETLPDESLYGYMDGTVTGAAVSGTGMGRFGQGLVFNENDIVNVQLNNMDLLPVEEWPGFSIETWFKLDQIPEGTGVLFRLSEGDRIVFELSVRNNRLMGLSSENAVTIDTLLSDAEFPLTTGQWYHGALTYGEDLKLYLNGFLADEKETDVPEPTGLLTATVGNDPGLTKPFHGTLDEMRLSGIARQPWEFNINTGRIQVPYGSLAFGNVYVNRSKYIYMYVRNVGSGVLYVDSLYTKNPHFTVSEPEFSINSSGQRLIWVGFRPTNAQAYTDTLFIRSQDQFQSLIRVPLSGNGFETINLGAYVTDTYTSGLWHLDGTVEMDSIPDASGKGLVGYFEGGGLSWSDIYKKFGLSSLRFLGSSGWVRVPYNPVFNYASSPFSLETWFSLSAKPSGKNFYTLFRRGSGTSLQYEVMYGDTLTAGKGLVIRLYSSGGQIYTLYGPPDTEMNIDSWYQMALTWDLNKFRLYVNGVAVDSVAFNGTLRSSVADLALGGDYGTGHGFNGYLDEIRFSNIDRQPEEFNVGIPNIYTAAQRLEFGTVMVGSSANRIIEVSNIGGVPLVIDTIRTNQSVFLMAPAKITLTAGETTNLFVQFVPDTIRTVTDTLRIFSNDPDTPMLSVPILAVGIDYRPKVPYGLDQYTVALWHCDETGLSVADATGNHNGTMAGTGSRVNPAYFSGGLSFNGVDEYMWVADDAGLQFDLSTESFTVECFFKTDTLNQVLFHKDPHISGSENRSNYGLIIDTDGLLTLHGFGKGNTCVADGVWHHAAFVYDGTVQQATLYLDGNVELQGLWHAGDTDIVSPGRLVFAARETATGQLTGFFDGTMDEIRISSIARQPWDLIFKGTGISASYTTVPQKGVQQAVQITVPVTTTDKEVYLHYRQGGQRGYQTLTATPDQLVPTLYQAIVPADQMTERGLEFYVEMVTSGRTSTHPLYDPINRPMAARVRFNSLTADTSAMFLKKKYVMVSVPADLDDANAGTVLLDEFNNVWDPYEWRCLTWKDTSYWEMDDSLSYADSLVFAFDQGRAFWVISAARKLWDVNAGASVSTNGPYRFSLRPQWSMIGSPFPFTVHWNDCALTSDSLETLYYYNGMGYRLDWPTLDPWGGYWIYNAGRTYNDLIVPPRESAALAKGAATRGGVLESLAESDWIWKLSARAESAEDLDNYIGVRQDARAEWDLRDRVEPPPIGEYISVFFDHSDWAGHPGTYAADIRSPQEEGFVWDIAVESSLNKKLIKLTWQMVQTLPESWKIMLVDEREGIALDVTDMDDYAMVTPDEVPNVRFLKCIAGPPEFVQKQLENAVAPREFHLYQNYPNPFNPVTMIKYSLPRTGHVKLSVYNMRGECVNVLINQEQQSGEYEIRWSGLSNRGTALSSGIYFYKLEFPGRVAIRKMMLVR
ncbi:choice-of-anchor D domain-containing protein [bacterium]|nr:choice-of-anchor D domain-containing protein [bacterium]